MSWIQSEPAVFIGILEAVVIAVINLVLAFGVEVTAEQITAINGFVGAILVLVLSLYTRSKVTPIGKE